MIFLWFSKVKINFAFYADKLIEKDKKTTHPEEMPPC